MALLALMARGISPTIGSHMCAQGVTKKSIYLSISTAGLTSADGRCADSAISAGSFPKMVAGRQADVGVMNNTRVRARGVETPFCQSYVRAREAFGEDVIDE